MTRPHIVHLIDDATAGGVMRVLDFIAHDPEMAANARHSVRHVRRGALSFGRIDADVIVSHLTLSWRALPGFMALRALHAGLPLVHVEHSYTSAFCTLNVRHKARFATLLRTGYALFDRVVAVSAAQARWMRSWELVEANALRVIRPVVALERFRALPRPRREVRVIGAIGRLDRQKGFATLIPAFRAAGLGDTELHVYGTGPERAALQALAAGDPRIRFMGHAETPEAAMAGVDMVVMPSLWEAFGLVALEARAAGRPVLVSGVDGLGDQMEQGAIGVPGGGVADWAAALREAMQDRPQAMPETAPEAVFVTAWRDLIGELVAIRSEASIPAPAGIALALAA